MDGQRVVFGADAGGEMSQTYFCKHYRAPSNHSSCEAGITYATLPCYGTAPRNWPCYGKRGQPLPTGCESASYPTEDELAAEDAEMEKRCENLGKARKAIVAHLGGPWKRGTPGSRGVISCPVCGGATTLHFSRAGLNGHIHARCATVGCVSWME